MSPKWLDLHGPPPSIYSWSVVMVLRHVVENTRLGRVDPEPLSLSAYARCDLLHGGKDYCGCFHFCYEWFCHSERDWTLTVLPGAPQPQSRLIGDANGGTRSRRYPSTISPTTHRWKWNGNHYRYHNYTHIGEPRWTGTLPSEYNNKIDDSMELTWQHDPQ